MVFFFFNKKAQIPRLQSIPKDSNLQRAGNVHLESAPLMGLKQLVPWAHKGVSNTHVLLLGGLQAAPCPDGQFLSAFSSL